LTNGRGSLDLLPPKLEGVMMKVSGHACYTFAQRTGCPYEKALEIILEEIDGAKEVSSEEVKEHHREKNKKRRYFVKDNLIFVLNPKEDVVVTVLIKDEISRGLYGPILTS
jgi:hypothetical protein